MIRVFAVLILLSAAAFAQAPQVGDINLYGLRRVQEAKLLQAADLHSGGRLPASKGDLEDRIEQIPGVVLARVEAVCCDGSNTILFVGIVERGAPAPAFASAPAGDAVLPAQLVEQYRQFLDAVQRAAARGSIAEDLSSGHSMIADPQVRPFQEKFVEFASTHQADLRAVVRTGSEAEQRAIAAAVIGYAPPKQDIVDDLQQAVQDPDDSVRVNAIRSLGAIAVWKSRNPKAAVAISPTWMVQSLNSVVLSDRVESVRALINLTENGNPQTLALLRERAMPALVEMARWKTLSYALPPFLLVGRVAGLSDRDIQQAWAKGEREPVIAKATAPPARR